MKQNYIRSFNIVWFVTMFTFSFAASGAGKNPSDPSVAVPEVKIESVYNNYVPAVTEPLSDWKVQFKHSTHEHASHVDESHDKPRLPEANHRHSDTIAPHSNHQH